VPVDYRQQVHDSALDAAESMLVAGGWERLRFGDVAAAIGGSRPTLYASFANKEALAEALVLRETERFLAGIGAALDAHAEDLDRAVTAGVAYTFAEAERSRILHAVLTSSRGGGEGLLPFLTTRARPVLEAASAVLVQWVREHAPAIPADDVADGVDALVRLVVSHLVLPSDDPTRTPEKLARVAVSYLTRQPSS
jgi:AcrR family transcriptional regulator